MLLRPDMHGVLLGVALTALNVIESSVYLILLPDARWIMVGTVLARTALLLLIAVEWLGRNLCNRAGQRMQRVAAQLAGAVMLQSSWASSSARRSRRRLTRIAGWPNTRAALPSSSGRPRRAA
ncbi:MAG: hypothetical protein H6643_03650 [Caldilineaceae bacterium]|nr:hypothetical protein [Caldilineaceae bacterium]